MLIESSLSGRFLYTDGYRCKILLFYRCYQLTADMLCQSFGGDAVHRQDQNVISREDISSIFKSNFPLFVGLFDIQVLTLHGQQKTVVQAITNSTDNFLKRHKIKNITIFRQVPFQDYRHGVVVAVKPLTLAAKRNKMGGTEIQIPFFHLNFVHKTVL